MVELIPEPLARIEGFSAPDGLAEQCRAARRGCAVFAARHRAMALATGDDRIDFLQGMLTNDVRAATGEQWCDAAFLTDSGKVTGMLRFLREAEQVRLDSHSWAIDGLLSGLDRYLIADDVELERCDDEAPLICLEGPESGAVAAAVFGADLGAVAAMGQTAGEIGGATVQLARLSEIGGDGVLVWGATDLADEAVDACAERGAQRAGSEALHYLRVAAGIPWVGVDMGDDTLLMEMELEQSISRTKGCYLGQEVVERVSARGRVNRRRTGFEVATDGADPGPLPWLVEDAEGAEVGSITSAARDPETDRILALGLLHRKAEAAPALRLRAGGRSVETRATS